LAHGDAGREPIVAVVTQTSDAIMILPTKAALRPVAEMDGAVEIVASTWLEPVTDPPEDASVKAPMILGEIPELERSWSDHVPFVGSVTDVNEKPAVPVTLAVIARRLVDAGVVEKVAVGVVDEPPPELTMSCRTVPPGPIS
jgi:hypothetical protein